MKNRKYIFGTRLAYLRKQRNLSQVDLAHILGINQTQISKMENGHTLPRWENFFSIIQFFDCSSDFLIQNSKFPKEQKYEDAIQSLKDPKLKLKNRNIEIPDEQAERIMGALKRAVEKIVKDIVDEDEDE